MNIEDYMRCDEEDTTLYDEIIPEESNCDKATSDFLKFVKNRLKFLDLGEGADTYISPPPYKPPIKLPNNTEKSSSSAIFDSPFPVTKLSPEIEIPCFCGGKEIANIILSQHFTVCAENDGILFRPFDSSFGEEYLLLMKERMDSLEENIQFVLEPEAKNSRTIAVKYIMQFKKYCNCTDRTLFVAIKFLDKYIALTNAEIWRQCSCHILLLSATCMTLAARLEEAEVPFMAKFVGFSKIEIRETQIDVIRTLGWRLWVSSPFEILDIVVDSQTRNEMERKKILSQSSEFIFATCVKSYMRYGSAELALSGFIATISLQEVTRKEIESLIGSFGIFRDVNVSTCVELVDQMRKNKRQVGSPPSPKRQKIA